MPSTPRSSSCSTRRCAAGRSPLVEGVVLAASYEAKAFGVHGGMPGRRARELCPQLTFVSGHFEDYQRLGDAAIKVLGDFTPLVERISIDEAFADVEGSILSLVPRRNCESGSTPRAGGARAADSVGVARTKHLAKIASQVAKPDGLVVVDPETELGFLHDLPVELMWGVGPVAKARLAEAGVLTIGQLARPRQGRWRRCSARRWGRSWRRWRGTATAGNRDASAGTVGRSTVSNWQEARRRASFPTHAASSRGPDRDPAPGQIAVRPDRVGARALCRSSVGYSLCHVASADFGDGNSCRDRRGAGAWGLADHPGERTISLLAISVSNLEEHSIMQLELPLGLEDEKRRPGSKKGMARWVADSLSTQFAIALDGRRSGMGRPH